MKVFKIVFCIILTMIAITAISTYYSVYNEEKILKIKYNQLTTDARKQVDCLAENIYYEAGYEPKDGQYAVAMVTMNRVLDPRFPKDICSVVKQKVNSTCQFTWFCDGSSKRIPNPEIYKKNLEIALLVYVNYENLQDNTNGAKFYHADYVNPRWKLEKTTKIGRHIFYKD